MIHKIGTSFEYKHKDGGTMIILRAWTNTLHFAIENMNVDTLKDLIMQLTKHFKSYLYFVINNNIDLYDVIKQWKFVNVMISKCREHVVISRKQKISNMFLGVLKGCEIQLFSKNKSEPYFIHKHKQQVHNKI